MLFQVLQVLWYLPYQFIHIRIFISIVSHHKHMLRELGYLEERLRCHILHSRVLLMHKFIELLYHGL